MRHLAIKQYSLVRTLLAIASVVLISAWLIHLSNGLFDSPQTQRDLRTYQQSSKLYAEGTDPYDWNILVYYSKDTSLYRYAYPPQTLPVVRGIFWTIGNDPRLYFGIQIAAIIVLLALWKTYFIRHNYALPLLALFLVFGFNSAASVDITAGNITFISNCLLWAAFVLFLRKRYAIFSIIIIAVALFKGVEILFLLLMLFEHDRRAMRWCVAGISFFFVLHLVTAIASPTMYQEWLYNVYTNLEWGASNPAALSAIDGASFGLCRLLRIANPWPHIAQVVYLVYVIIVLTLSWSLLRRSTASINKISLIVLALFGFAILLPRFKDYSYILLIAPAVWMVLYRIRNIWLKTLAIALVITPFYKYQPLIVAIGFYGYLLFSLRSEATVRPVHSVDSSPSL